MEEPALKTWFDREFWPAYPWKSEKPAAWMAVRSVTLHGATAGDIMASLDRWRTSADWAKEDGKYIPKPANWLLRGTWKDEPRQAKPASTDRPKGYNLATLIATMKGGDGGEANQ